MLICITFIGKAQVDQLLPDQRFQALGRGPVGVATKSNEELKEPQEYEIIRTIHTLVLKSYPKAETPAEYTTAQQKAEWWSKYFERW